MKLGEKSFNEGLGFVSYELVEVIQEDIRKLRHKPEEMKSQLDTIQQSLETLRKVEAVRLHYLGISNELLAEKLGYSESNFNRFLEKAKRDVGIQILHSDNATVITAAEE